MSGGVAALAHVGRPGRARRREEPWVVQVRGMGWALSGGAAPLACAGRLWAVLIRGAGRALFGGAVVLAYVGLLGLARRGRRRGGGPVSRGRWRGSLQTRRWGCRGRRGLRRNRGTEGDAGSHSTGTVRRCMWGRRGVGGAVGGDGRGQSRQCPRASRGGRRSGGRGGRRRGIRPPRAGGVGRRRRDGRWG